MFFHIRHQLERSADTCMADPQVPCCYLVKTRVLRYLHLIAEINTIFDMNTTLKNNRIGNDVAFCNNVKI